MANLTPNASKADLLSAVFNLPSDTIKIALVTASYTPSAGSDHYIAAISSNIVARSGALSSKTVTNGVFNHATVTWPLVSGSAAKYLVYYKDTGADASSPILRVIDTVSAGLPVTPNGNDITFTPNASGVFSLS